MERSVAGVPALTYRTPSSLWTIRHPGAWITRRWAPCTKGWQLPKRDQTFLYATNFRDAIVEKYDSNFKFVKTFADTNVPAGFAPFGIREIRGRLFVTFALQNDKK